MEERFLLVVFVSISLWVFVYFGMLYWRMVWSEIFNWRISGCFTGVLCLLLFLFSVLDVSSTSFLCSSSSLSHNLLFSGLDISLLCKMYIFNLHRWISINRWDFLVLKPFFDRLLQFMTKLFLIIFCWWWLLYALFNNLNILSDLLHAWILSALSFVSFEDALMLIPCSSSSHSPLLLLRKINFTFYFNTENDVLTTKRTSLSTERWVS